MLKKTSQLDRQHMGWTFYPYIYKKSKKKINNELWGSFMFD